MNTYRMTILAVLASLAITGRYAFQFLPNVQPVTALIIICGVLLGPLSAILLAIITTFLSNMLLGMGIWAIWQILSWGLIGLISGILGKLMNPVPLFVLLVFGALSGYFYGFIVSLTSYQISGQFLPYYLAGLPFDTSHAIGNTIFILILYPLLKKQFGKYAKLSSNE